LFSHPEIGQIRHTRNAITAAELAISAAFSSQFRILAPQPETVDLPVAANAPSAEQDHMLRS
jgi:hypothetical protein